MLALKKVDSFYGIALKRNLGDETRKEDYPSIISIF